MGCIIGSLISSVACCCCNAAAGLCCACLPSLNSSTSSRLMYLLYFTLCIITAIVMLHLDIGSWMRRIPVLCPPYETDLHRVALNFNFNCTFSSNFGGIYRCCFGLSVFFFLLSLTMIKVQTSTEFRGKMNNGFWFWKLITLALIVTCSILLMPDPYFSSIWFVFGLIGGFLYILIQLVLIVDFAHIWNEKWVDKYEIDDSNIYYYALIAFTITFYSISISLISVMIYYFGSNSSCHLHRFFILFDVVLSLLATGISVSPKVQESTQRSGLLQASLITIYIAILTWGALISSPDPVCNPTLEYLKFYPNEFSTKFPNNSVIRPEDNNYKLQWSYYIIVSVGIYYVFIFYFSVRDSFAESRRASMPEQNNEITTVSPQRNANNITNKYQGQQVVDNEKDSLKYDYSLFHFIYCLGAIYLQMTLTNWLNLQSDNRVLKINSMAMWIKICGSWISVLLYIWTLLAPVLFPDRNFN